MTLKEAFVAMTIFATLWAVEDVVSADASPDDVWEAGALLGTALERGTPVGCHQLFDRVERPDSSSGRDVLARPAGRRITPDGDR